MRVIFSLSLMIAIRKRLKNWRPTKSSSMTPNAGGYFITHDIYEEWALDKFIEQAFIGAMDYGNFYQVIGTSLPVRRALRNWLSLKLFMNDENARRLIEFTVKDSGMDGHWKDEILVSVLLSDYSGIFFERFEDELLEGPDEESSGVVRASGAGSKYEDRLTAQDSFSLADRLQSYK